MFDEFIAPFQALTFIITHDQCNALSKLARKHQLSATKILAKGTVASQFLKAWGITEDRREMVTMLLPLQEAKEFLEVVNRKLQLSKPGHGIAYATNILACAGMHHQETLNLQAYAKKVAEEMMYHKITVIVDRGNAEKVMETARKAGAQGGTILHGRGSTGAQEARKIFGIEIEPEKEIVTILTPAAATQTIFEAIAREMEIEKPGKGIMYVEGLSATSGLYEQQA